ncbi:diatom-specific cyclin (Partial), partial [Seminavis robusta]|eukprot:Sro3210_g345280.1 diatom-specific cyclin (248) ;mRNA; r:106-850
MTPENESVYVGDTISTLKAMKQQELRYVCQDYCILHASDKNSKTLREDRKLMVKWCYNVLDFFNLHRETGAIAMAYVDRYLQTPFGPEYLQDTDKYQLLCITSLYLAIKVHESPTLTPGAFVEIGRGHYSADQIVALESKILEGLQWRVNPPTALSFVRHLLDLVPSMAHDDGIKATAYMLARAQTERAIGEQGLMTVAPSKIAFVAVRNALEALGYCDFPLYDACQHFYSKPFLYQEVHDLRPRSNN